MFMPFRVMIAFKLGQRAFALRSDRNPYLPHVEYRLWHAWGAGFQEADGLWRAECECFELP